MTQSSLWLKHHTIRTAQSYRGSTWHPPMVGWWPTAPLWCWLVSPLPRPGASSLSCCGIVWVVWLLLLLLLPRHVYLHPWASQPVFFTILRDLCCNVCCMQRTTWRMSTALPFSTRRWIAWDHWLMCQPGLRFLQILPRLSFFRISFFLLEYLHTFLAMHGF